MSFSTSLVMSFKWVVICFFSFFITSFLYINDEGYPSPLFVIFDHFYSPIQGAVVTKSNKAHQGIMMERTIWIKPRSSSLSSSSSSSSSSKIHVCQHLQSSIPSQMVLSNLWNNKALHALWLIVSSQTSYTLSKVAILVSHPKYG